MIVRLVSPIASTFVEEAMASIRIGARNRHFTPTLARTSDLSSDDDQFTPRLGPAKSGGGKHARRYLGLVAAAVWRAGRPQGGGNRKFDGSRIGRGAGVGRLLSSNDRHGGMRSRRVVVKTRLIRMSRKGPGATSAHVRYIQRDGVTRDGDPGRLYSQDSDVADGKAFVDRVDGDRHHFRLIVSPEDGDQFAELKPFVRRLMTQMETDLATGLEWVAVDHYNTGQPHSHIMLRGRDDRGENLIVARDYVAHGLRARACQIATLELGPRTDLEIESRLRRDVGEERWTAVDRQLLRDCDRLRIVTADAPDPLRQSLRAGRLQKLGKLGLADDLGGGRWRLVANLEARLRAMGERGDIIRALQRALAGRAPGHGIADAIIHGRGEGADLVGRVKARGLADELHDRHFLIVDGLDGRVHYVDIGRGDAVGPLADEAIVRIAPRVSGAREVDRTIAAIAAANGGRYDLEAHLRHDPTASEAFAATHVRRLEALRRTARCVDRSPDASWAIAPDHLARVEAFEARQMHDRPVTVETLSPMPLDRLASAEAVTWLDRELVAQAPLPLRDAGFGGDVRKAQALRRQWLMAQGLADDATGVTTFRADLVETLRRREVARVAGRLSSELGLAFAETRPGERVEGVLRRSVEMVSGRHALIERRRDFTLVPWRPMLERHVGRTISGMLRGDNVNWTVGRSRSGPTIS